MYKQDLLFYLQNNKNIDTEKVPLKQYSKYFRDVSELTYMDVYSVCQVFGISDPSGAIQHAIKKLLLSGVRTGNKSHYQDIEEARDTLNRWLEMNHNKKENI
ncbi:Uncharacterised protein [Oligella urethralis]|nr:Uncharacterised protein [Oligella urethralis]